MSSTEVPIIQVSARNVPRNEVAVAIYEFANSQDYINALSQRDYLPWWSYSKEDFMQDVSALKFISEFKQIIKKNPFITNRSMSLSSMAYAKAFPTTVKKIIPIIKFRHDK